ncbi:MAG TPA: S1 RNA-binding domain-containing protein, partial [Syntrophorhabdaceae bacterium]
QAAGFLRISGAANPLDSSAVHPESYSIVEAMARDLSVTVGDLISSKELRNKLDLTKYMTESVGLPTLRDIMSELDKPGRDPREEFEVFSFTQGVEKIEDLRLGMKLPGIVTNVTAFGAFIDIGVHQDGLVHISELADRFVRNPHDIVKVHQKVTVTVLDVQTGRKRISLSMKNK